MDVSQLHSLAGGQAREHWRGLSARFGIILRASFDAYAEVPSSWAGPALGCISCAYQD